MVHVIVTMIQTSKKGQSKLVGACTLPLTGVRCVDRIVTDLAVIDVSATNGLIVRELAPGVTEEDFTAACDAEHTFATDIKVIEV